MKSGILCAALLVGLNIHSAQACIDDRCTPSWTLDNDCNDAPMLTPYNDTGTNLELLMVGEQIAAFEVAPDMMEFNNTPFYMGSIRLAQTKAVESVQPDVGDYGTRCISNAAGKAAFLAALNSNEGIPDAEKQLLAEARQKFQPTCADAPASSGDAKDANKRSEVLTVDAAKIASPLGQQFAQYLSAAAAFYQGRYDEAMTGFRSLAASSHPWLKETALYMQGRVELNHAQKDEFDKYGFHRSKIDKEIISSAEQQLQGYLEAYPAGRYAASARGLVRRAYWLSDQTQKLADEYGWLMNHLYDPQNNLTLSELVSEARRKMLRSISPEQVRHPLLLAALDLLLMQPKSELGKNDASPQLSLADLQKQEPLFSKHKELHQYLIAAHYFYAQNNPSDALKLLPDAVPATMTYFDSSRLMLRGLALEATNEYLAARKLWLQMLPAAKQPLQSEAVQLALAINYEQHKETEAVFADNSPITNAAIRNRLIRNVASPDVLRQVIAKSSSPKERHVALHTLLWKDLLQGQYKDYVQDHALLTKDMLTTDCEDCPFFSGLNDNPSLSLFGWSGNKSKKDSYDCPSTIEIAKKLAKNAHDSHGLICLGDFIHENDMDYTLYSTASDDAAEDKKASSSGLGSSASAFPGKVFSRGEAYQHIIADKKAAPNLKAYALYRAIKCYETSGNHCGGNGVDVSVRKSWFHTLHKRYADSVWAERLGYYW